jgi:SRSO17 transposase
MANQRVEISEQNFMAYLERLTAAVGHADRHEPLRVYLEGLLLPGERKSVEPMAARIDPRHVPSRHQSMHHFVATSPWDADELISVARDYALAEFEHHGGVDAWVLDDTSYPKKGTHSVGVARQYCGVMGKQDNCQVAVSISLANELMSVPATYRLYLPQSWAEDQARRKVAGVPEAVAFQTKTEMALDQIDHLLAEDVPKAPVVMDAFYGRATDLRDQIAKRGLQYVAAVREDMTVFLAGPVGARAPIAVKDLAKGLPKTAWRSVWWRHGTKGDMRSRFALLRVRVAHQEPGRRQERPLEWLLIEWPTSESEPVHYWLSNLPAGTRISKIVNLAQMRWRIERDYEELKGELGLDHYEGRGWVGFHHHGALCIAAYAFLIAERARLSPPHPLSFLRPAPLPQGFRPRGSPRPARAP